MRKVEPLYKFRDVLYVAALVVGICVAYLAGLKDGVRH